MNAALNPNTATASTTDVWPALQRTINEVCSLRGDDATNHRALLAECAAQPAEMQADLLAHFEDVARLYRAALKVPEPPRPRVKAAMCAPRGARS